MLNLLNLFSLKRSLLLSQFHILLFYVLLFHVRHFHVQHFQRPPVESDRATSRSSTCITKTGLIVCQYTVRTVRSAITATAELLVSYMFPYFRIYYYIIKHM